MVSSQEIDGSGRAPMHGTMTTLPAAEKKQGAGKLMGKLFGRQSESKAAGMETLEEENEELVDPESFWEGITPCPYIRPLEHRLEPRVEFIRSRRQLSNASSNVVVSPITRARNRGETNAILTGQISDEDLEYADKGDNVNGAPLERAEAYPENISLSDVEQIDYVAVMASHHPDGVEQWRYWIECYAKGQFNLTNPPSPPQRSGSFGFLHAVYPPNETERSSLCSRYDIVWAQWAQENVGKVVQEAMKRFGTRFASLSFFDDNSELFKVENGYNRSQVPRSESIAAHVLYSSDVMVVLDTKQDWRFEDHPLVNHRPKIRFFAGAPLLSADGEVMGVLAVFEKEPRTTFSPQQRRELAEYSTAIMSDLNYQADCLSNPELRTTPLLQRDSVIYGEYRPRNIPSPVMGFRGNDVDHDLVPPALHYHKPLRSSEKKPRLYLKRQSQNNFAHHAEPTPPSSAESNHNGFFDKLESFGKNEEQLSEDPVLNDISSLGPQTTSDCRRLRISTPRPFSASDITSLNPHPPNTPDRSVKDEELSHQPKFDLTVEDFMSLSDTDCVEESQEQPKMDEHVDRSSSKQRKEAIQQQQPTENVPLDAMAAADPASGDIANGPSTLMKDSSAGNSFPTTESSPLNDLSTPPRNPDHSMALVPYTPSPSDDPNSRKSGLSTKSSQSHQLKTNRTNAAYACSVFAQQFDYDLIYCVELKPSLPFMTDQELFAENGLHKWFLTAYGLALPLDLSSEIHIRALRSREGVYWNNRQDHYEEGEYATGYMVPVYSEGSGPRVLRSSGIVLGAFRKPRPKGKSEMRHAEDDRARLLEFGKTLGYMLLKKQRPTTKRSNIEPVAPSPYPANEAVEVTFGDAHTRNHSLRTRYTGAYPANEATEATFGDIRTSKHSANSSKARYAGSYPANEAVEVTFGNRHTNNYSSRFRHGPR